MTFRPPRSGPRASFPRSRRDEHVPIFYKDHSTMILEEWRDPASWKMLMWLEPERVHRHAIHRRLRALRLDTKWGWVPSGWRVTYKVEDGSRRGLTTARVTSYAINEPVSAREFELDVVNAVPVTVPGR